MASFCILNDAGEAVGAEEGTRLVGMLQRPGFEDKDSRVGEHEGVFYQVPMHECYLEYYSEEKVPVCTLWARGDKAWYRLDKPAACYEEVLYNLMNRLKLGDILKSQLLKTPKVSWERLAQVVASKAVAFVVPHALKPRVREKLTRSVIMSEAPYLTSCIDDVGEVCVCVCVSVCLSVCVCVCVCICVCALAAFCVRILDGRSSMIPGYTNTRLLSHPLVYIYVCESGASQGRLASRANSPQGLW
jgi:hypothetical protein